MSLSANNICGLCRISSATWRCACTAVFLCQSPICLSTHFSSACVSPHLFIPIDVETLLTPEEAKHKLQECDLSMISRFINEEKEWIQRRKLEIFSEISHEAQKLCEEIQQIAENAKQKVAAEAQNALSLLDNFRNLDNRDHLFRLRASCLHLVSLNFLISGLVLRNPFEVSVETISENKRTYRNLGELSGNWSFDGVKIDAITIQPSKEIYLSGIVLPQAKRAPVRTEVKLMHVLEGDNTQGNVVYVHPQVEYLRPDQPMTLLNLTKLLLLLPNRKYTVKLILEGSSTCKGDLWKSREQDGLEIKVYKTIFRPPDGDNGCSTEMSIFFGFEYI